MPSHPLSEAVLRQHLAREGLTPSRWSNGPHAVYGRHDHPYGKVLVVAEGAITFTLESPHRVIDLRAGDRLELPPRTVHSAIVGPGGVVCLEAHLEPPSAP